MQEVPLALASRSRDDKYVEVGACLLNRKFAGSLSLIFDFDKFECNSWIFSNERKFKIFILNQVERLFFLILSKFVELFRKKYNEIFIRSNISKRDKIFANHYCITFNINF